MKKQKDEVIEVEAEEINPLEKVIETTLVKHNVTEAVIATLKEKYGGLKLRFIDDKENYLIIKESRGIVRKVGILAERLCEEGRADAVKVQRLWIAKQKEVLSKIAEVQDPLDAEIKTFDDEVKRKEDSEKKRKEEIFVNRQSTLLKYGARFSNGSFVLNHIEYESINIQEADEEVWDKIIMPKYRAQFEEVEAARVAEENKRREDAEKLKKEQEDFKKQQDDFRKQQQEFENQKREAERLQREEQQRKENEERQKRNELQISRFNILIQYKPTGADVDMTSLASLSEERFIEISEALKVKFKKSEEERITLLQEQAAQKEREKIAEDNRLAEIKKQQELDQQKEEAAKASDKEKWELFLHELSAINLPEFKSKVFKNKLAIAKEKMSEIESL